jgi:transcriptional regulator with XRE-family HTH domain
MTNNETSAPTLSVYSYEALTAGPGHRRLTGMINGSSRAEALRLLQDRSLTVISLDITDPQALFERLRLARQARQMTQTQLAQLAGITQATLSRMEQGAIIKPTFETVIALAGALRISVQALADVSPRLFLSELENVNTDETEHEREDPFASAAVRAKVLERVAPNGALEDLRNWIANPGTHILIAGEAKTGKSTLLRLLADLIPLDDPDELNIVNNYHNFFLDIGVRPAVIHELADGEGLDKVDFDPEQSLRLLVDDIRGGEILPYLQLLNSNSSVVSSLATYHSRSSAMMAMEVLDQIGDCIARAAGDERLLNNLDIVITVARDEVGFCITEISQVVCDTDGFTHPWRLYFRMPMGDFRKVAAPLPLGCFA